MLAPWHGIVQYPPAAVRDDEWIPVCEIDLVEVITEDIVRTFGWDGEIEVERDRRRRIRGDGLIQIDGQSLPAESIRRQHHSIL